MDLPFSKEQLREATHELIGRNGLRSLLHPPARVPRPRADGPRPRGQPGRGDRSPCGSGAPTWARRASKNGVRAKVSSWRRISPQSLIPHSKAGGQYLNSVLAKIESKRGGYEEAILLDDRGHVCEGTGENIFVVKDGRIATPPQTASILDGISRKSVIEIAADLGLDGGRARHRPRRADAGRRGVPRRHRRRAGAGARDRRHRDRPARRDHPRRSSRSTTTPCTGATSATRSGSTWCRYHRRRERRAVRSELRDAPA